MNVQRTPYSDIPASPECKQETEELAGAFFRSLDAVKQSTSLPENTSGDDHGSTPDYLYVNLKGQSQRLKAYEAWGNDLAEQELRNKTLRKSWLIERACTDCLTESEMTIVSSTAVTDDFRYRVKSFLRKIPGSLKQAVRSNNTEILVVGNVGEFDQDLAFEPVRRHPQCEVVGNLQVYYEPRLNALIFAEKPHAIAGEPETGGRLKGARNFLKQLGVCLGRQARVKQCPSLVRNAAHEFGRAVDKAILNFSLGKEFDHAFQSDLAKLSETEKSKLWYFTATCVAYGKTGPGYDAAKEELFAELFALHLGLGRVSPEIGHLLVKKFSSVNALLKSKLESNLTAGKVSCPG